MEQAALHNFLHRYFTANDCDIVEDQDGVMTVQLTDEVDEMLMNRPFYWHYVKRIGGQGMPMKVTFITNPEKQEEKGEWIHFGSPRLHKMFQTLREKGRITRQYEQVTPSQGQTSLVPWLMINASVQYKGTQRKDEVLSIGLNLMNGGMIPGIMEKIDPNKIGPIINDYCFTLTPMIRMPSAIKRVEQYINTYIKSQDHSWSVDALQQLESEKELLSYFFRHDLGNESEQEEDAEAKEDAEKRYQDELNKLEERFQPSISVELINAGVLYFSQESSTRFIKGE
ncbi:YqhG family protein [Pontibacillus marinus]|uniref:YqhG n=1 Tax=Pontibacillus marinus BH030004 = DSM 16465 TaxID=1385511 RepID=A0A0A5HN37_9BACI|nr:YqhG family protein [Pontibacillus marinus]KGX85002.1 hypothetical protein N783_15380 [Pontibacillus marinus BH030004 = DSM 16465]